MRILIHQAGARPGDRKANLAEVERVLGVAAAAGADLAVFPEMFITGYNVLDEVAQLAEPAGGLVEQRLRDMAAGSGLGCIVGLPEIEGQHVRNVALCLDGDGEVLARHAKVRLFGNRERATFAAGTGFPTCTIAGRKVGIAICYDIEFPETARALARAGAEVLVVPTANMTPYWDVPTTLVRSRALENGVAVAYANLCGFEGDMRFTGLSAVVAPDGRDLARAGTDAATLIVDLEAAFDRARRSPTSTQLDELG